MEQVASDTNPLARYKKAKGLTDDQLASQLEIDRTQVVKYRTGARNPSLQAALRISERTNGEIPPEAWRREQ